MEMINMIVVPTSLIVIIIQLYLSYKIFKADHERRKKEATIEYINNVRQLWSKNRQDFDKKFGAHSHSLTDEDVSNINNDKELKETVRGLLGLLEHISVGMNTGVYDKNLLFRMSGKYLIDLFDRFKPYIKESQKENPYSYIEFEELVVDFQERKRLRPDPRDNMKYS